MVSCQVASPEYSGKTLLAFELEINKMVSWPSG